MRFSGTVAVLLAFGSWALLARAEPNVVPARPPRAEASKPSPSCTAPTMQGSEQGEPIGSACVANTQCVGACGNVLGEAIAAAHEPQDDACKGNAECERNESSLRVNTANLQTGVFVACLEQCWAPKKSGQCRSEFDCAPSGPCAAVDCDERSCSEVTKYDGTRCADSTGAIGACLKGKCASPPEYLSQCGDGAALGAKALWLLSVPSAQRCRSGACDSSDRFGLANLPRILTREMLQCVSTALELGADPKGTHGKR